MSPLGKYLYIIQAEARDALKLKLQSMESKLINGGDVIQKTAIMEKELQEKQRFVLLEKFFKDLDNNNAEVHYFFQMVQGFPSN